MYRIVVQEKSQAPKAGAKENLGSYNPHVAKREEQIVLNTERVQYWLSVGAQPSPTIHNMLVELGILTTSKKRVVNSKKKGEEEQAEEKATEEAKTEETPEKATE